jgi:hypothetical protein
MAASVAGVDSGGLVLKHTVSHWVLRFEVLRCSVSKLPSEYYRGLLILLLWTAALVALPPVSQVQLEQVSLRLNQRCTRQQVAKLSL